MSSTDQHLTLLVTWALRTVGLAVLLGTVVAGLLALVFHSGPLAAVLGIVALALVLVIADAPDPVEAHAEVP